MKSKLFAAEEEIRDLSAEFQIDRQDYLDTIRKQGRTIQLYEQLLSTIVPCIRRDCNYFNLDKIKTECSYNEDKNEWALPKLSISKTTLSQPGSASSGQATSLVKLPSSENTSGMYMPTAKNKKSPSRDTMEEDRYLLRLQQKGDDLSQEYFKPKRAMELLSSSPGHSIPLSESGSDSSLPNAATNRRKPDPLPNKRPGKLESLGMTPEPPTIPAPIPEPGLLEKVEMKLSNRKKSNLAPLAHKRTH